MSSPSPRQSSKTAGKWLAVILLPLLIFLLSAGVGLAAPFRAYVALTVWAILSWALSLMPEAFVGSLLPVLYIVAGVAKPAAAFAPWLTNVPWTSMGGLILGAVLLASGLAKRIAYWSILRTGASYYRTLAGLMLAGIILGPLIPSALGKMSIFCPLAIGICQALNLPPKSRAATAVMATAFFAVAGPTVTYLTGGIHIIMAMSLVSGVLQTPVSWSQYAVYNFIPGVIYSGLTLSLVALLLRPERSIDTAEVFRLQYKNLGPPTATEKKAAVVLAVTLVLLSTDTLHHIDPGWLLLLVAAVLFLPGVKLMDKEKFSKIDFSVILFIAGAMSIGSVAGALGAGRWFSGLIMPLLGAASAPAMLLSVYAVGATLTLFLTPIAGLATFTGPLTETALALGLNPFPVIYSLIYGMDQYIFPYQYGVLMLAFSYGYMSWPLMARVFAAKMALTPLFLLFVAQAYWRWLGLLP